MRQAQEQRNKEKLHTVHGVKEISIHRTVFLFPRNFKIYNLGLNYISQGTVFNEKKKKKIKHMPFIQYVLNLV